MFRLRTGEIGDVLEDGFSAGALIERRRRAALWLAPSDAPSVFDRALAEGRMAERVRIGEILAAAGDAVDLAACLAFDTDMTAAQAIDALRAARKTEAKSGSAAEAQGGAKE